MREKNAPNTHAHCLRPQLCTRKLEQRVMMMTTTTERNGGHTHASTHEKHNQAESQRHNNTTVCMLASQAEWITSPLTLSSGARTYTHATDGHLLLHVAMHFNLLFSVFLPSHSLNHSLFFHLLSCSSRAHP